MRQYRAPMPVESRAKVSRRWQEPRHRRVPRQGANDRGLPRERLRRRFERRARARPAGSRERRSGVGAQALRRARSRRAQGLRALLRRRSGQEEDHRGAKKRLADADELLLATDEDREGEAIAWHLVQVLKPKVPVRRMVFHEITKDAITRALAETRSIDDRLVDAQETRRILDRLYGYEVSPVLWKKVTRGLSAGRVQSVATRLVVERERERMAFRSAEYWDLLATFDPGAFEARLVAVDGARVAQGKDFEPTTASSARAASCISTRTRARSLAGRLEGASFAGALGRRAAVPAQARGAFPDRRRCSRRRAGSSASPRRRRCASHSVSTSPATSPTCGPTRPRSPSRRSKQRARRSAQLFGDDYVPDKPRRYGRAVANAQEAHEAIRPAGDTFRTPKELRGRAESRRARALRPRLEANPRVADGGRARPDRLASHRVRRATAGEDVEFAASRNRDHVPRLPRRLRAGEGRAVGRRRGARAPAARRRPGRFSF